MTVTEDATGLAGIATQIRTLATDVVTKVDVDALVSQGVSVIIGEQHVALSEIAQTANRVKPELRKVHDSLHELADRIDSLAQYLLGSG